MLSELVEGDPSRLCATPDQGPYLVHINDSLQMMSSYKTDFPPMIIISLSVVFSLTHLRP